MLNRLIILCPPRFTGVITMGGSSGFGYARTPLELDEGGPQAGLNPFFATLLGAWYSFTCAAAMTLGTKYLSDAPDDHYVLNSVGWVFGAGAGAALGSLLAHKSKVVVGSLSVIPCAAVWLLLLNLGRTRMDPVAFDWKPSAFAFGVTFLGFNLLCGVVGGVFGAQELTPGGFGESLAEVRLRHWWWLWVPAYAWVSMLPLALYYVWLEFVTTGYLAFHPSLWFHGSWERDFAFGLTPGLLGIGVLAAGIDLSLRSVKPRSRDETTKGRVARFIGGTVLLVSIVSPLLLNWGISHLKDMPVVKGSTRWWIL